MSQLRIALLQLAPAARIAATWKGEAFCRSCCSPGADIALLPEMEHRLHLLQPGDARRP